ncbi:hypothetical protein EG329_002004 [Mollisiaceae sp. DMI_Dod_QoI]|nr:hypothetical protein EG329_002004 [Helotiales sp. DMI_Dod_QoI]
MTDAQAAAEELRLSRFSKENRWYLKDSQGHIPPNSRKLLEEYSHIPPEDVDAHIYKMRDLLWSHAPFPCVGEFKFLILRLPTHPQYNRILSTLKSASAPYLLDLGCCVAPDLRSLAHSGIPSTQLYGSDLVSSYLTTSYELFNDKNSFKGTLVPANIFSETLFEEEFRGWEGKFTFIHAGLFLHLFGWERQVAASEQIVRLLKQEKGAMFLGEMAGCQGGGLRGGPARAGVGKEETKQWQYLHDEGSFEKLWGEVAEKTNTVGRWKIESSFKLRRLEKEKEGNQALGYFEGEGIGFFVFSVERI